MHKAGFPGEAYRNQNLNIGASPIEILTLLSRLRHVRKRVSLFWQSYNKAYEWLIATQRDTLCDYAAGSVQKLVQTNVN